MWMAEVLMSLIGIGNPKQPSSLNYLFFVNHSYGKTNKWPQVPKKRSITWKSMSFNAHQMIKKIDDTHFVGGSKGEAGRFVVGHTILLRLKVKSEAEQNDIVELGC